MDKYLNLVTKRKNLWNTKVTIIPIVDGALRTVAKCLERKMDDLEMKGRMETIHWNTDKRSGQLRKLAVSQIPVKSSY